jgi:hypothetical protein
MKYNEKPQSNYGLMVLDLIAIGSLLFVPQFLVTENNWRFIYLLLLTLGWILTGHFIWKIRKSLKESYERDLLRTFSIISFCLVIFLSYGTVRFFTVRKLQTVTGQCYLSALIKDDFQRYKLHLDYINQEFELSESQFKSILDPNQYTIKSSQFVLYPCKQEKITVTYVPHFNFFVRAE